MERSVQRSTCSYLYMAALMALCMGMCFVEVSDGAAADLKNCPTALVKLTACLPYSTGQSEVPTKECCTNLESVHEGQPECLCALVVASINGSDGAPKLNTTRSLGLGPACNVATKPSVCPGLLGLSPTDPLTKIFTTGAPTSTNLTPTNSTSTKSPSMSAPSTATTSTATTGGSSNSPNRKAQLPAIFLLSIAAFTLL